MQHNQSYEVRVLACDACSGPLESAPQDGTALCSYCGAENQCLPPRHERIEPEADRHGISEEERLGRLARDGGGDIPTHEDVKRLCTASGWLRHDRVTQANAMWRESRLALQQNPNEDIAQRFAQLTVKLSAFYTKQGDLLRVRGLLESALDLLTLPAHRHLIAVQLTRQAAEVNDLAGARYWLSLCDHRSLDIYADSWYRIARSQVETVEEDWNSVLVTLGRTKGEIPINSASVALTGILRANALERLGQHEQARIELISAMEHYAEYTTIKDHYDNLRAQWEKQGHSLCPETFGDAVRAVERKQIIREASEKASADGRNLLWVGALLVLPAVGFYVYLLVSNLTNWINFAAPAVFLIVGASLLFVGFRAQVRGRRFRRVRLQGLPATGTVVHVESVLSVYKEIDIPQDYRIDLLVQVEGREPYGASTIAHISKSEAERRYGKGSTVAVKVDPKDALHVVVQPY